MLNDVKGGLALALIRWRQTASIALILAMVSVAMSLVLGEALTQATALREGANLRASKAVAFSVYYATSGQSPISGRLLDLLRHERAKPDLRRHRQPTEPTHRPGRCLRGNNQQSCPQGFGSI